jgi:hypothetical protein
MTRLIDEREYLRTVRLPSGEVRLDVRIGVVGEWLAAQVFTAPVGAGVLDFFEQACDLTMETLGDELLAREDTRVLAREDARAPIAAARESLERDADRVRRLYRALSDV